MMKRDSVTLLWLVVLCSYIHITGCNNSSSDEEKTYAGKPTLQQLYWHTQVVNDAASNEVSVLVQFYENDASKKTVALPEGVTVLLDGQAIQADSSKQGGVFYEITKPLTGFTGTHELVIKAGDNTYTENFYFPDLPVVVLSGQPTEILYHRNNFTIDITPVSKMNNVRVVITDTAFPGKGFEMQVSPATAAITLQPSEIADIKNGPLVIEINGESGNPLTGKYPGEGKIDITAVIRNEATLKD